MPRPDSISLEEYRRLVGLPTTEQVERQEAMLEKPKRRRKFGERPTDHDSPLVGKRTYDSAREARRAEQLDLLWRGGEILWWLPQITIRLKGYTESRQRCMIVDFLICWKDGRVSWQDAKGKVTPEWSLKRDLVLDQYGISVETV